MLLEKLEEDENKATAQKEMMDNAKKLESSQKEFSQNLDKVQVCRACNLFLLIGKK